ncbi:hypothetical protein [Phreatobacter sp. AB_2022a]|uniref:hypothetical protein n=1 Tax=Phreatobacter sp. AB_2022a TaxID=3003134 RepID=UPI002287084D|nr:hypothetical protein [Phreatobacter sp. AB_2022a]MCZ0736301.1 hypothetical protein [Phreatobacter sp. AB_2022a]
MASGEWGRGGHHRLPFHPPFRYLAIRFTIAELGVTAPVSFGERERFSSRRVNIMRADVPNLTFRPVGE